MAREKDAIELIDKLKDYADEVNKEPDAVTLNLPNGKRLKAPCNFTVTGRKKNDVVQRFREVDENNIRRANQTVINACTKALKEAEPNLDNESPEFEQKLNELVAEYILTHQNSELFPYTYDEFKRFLRDPNNFFDYIDELNRDRAYIDIFKMICTIDNDTLAKYEAGEDYKTVDNGFWDEQDILQIKKNVDFFRRKANISGKAH